MKKTKKKNNKGFSLVELIVVVLIMAIIAVALAPQVMKWVGNSRTSTDINTMEQLVSNAQVCLTEKDEAWAQAKVAEITVKMDKDGVALTEKTNKSIDEVEKALKAETGVDNLTDIKPKDTTEEYSFKIVNGSIKDKSWEDDAVDGDGDGDENNNG